jgi:hypothetical protein
LKRSIFGKVCNLVNYILSETNVGRKGFLEEGRRFSLVYEMVKLVIRIIGRGKALAYESGLNGEILRIGLEYCRHRLMEVEREIMFEIIGNIGNEPSDEEEDVPEEFMDPLTFEIMRSPVRLETSKMVIDKSTFNQILLGDRIDPFNRMALDESMFSPEIELGERIQKYIRMRQRGSSD